MTIALQKYFTLSIIPILFTALTTLMGLGCGELNKQIAATNFDAAQLARYRAALPSAQTLTAAEPQAAGGVRAVGDPADYPNSSGIKDLLQGVNGAIDAIVKALDTVAQHDPTFYSAEEKMFFWGPWPHQEGPHQEGNGFGTIAVLIKEETAIDADFKYTYMFLRGVDTNVDNMVPVIWGGASPDETDVDEENTDTPDTAAGDQVMDDTKHGTGVTLWDLEAEYQFLTDNGQDTTTADRGRLVALYAKQMDVDAPLNEATWVYALLRDWKGADQPSTEAPLNIDYLFGHYENNVEGHVVDFLDLAFGMDVGVMGDDTPDGVVEEQTLRMVFFNEGAGRAEATIQGGSFTTEQSATITECWGAGLNRTYYNISMTDTATTAPVANWHYAEPTHGDGSTCEGPFIGALSTLSLPTLADIDSGLRSCFESVASHGLDNATCD